MTRQVRVAALLVGALALSFAGCNCEQKTNKRFPKIEVLDAEGNPRTSVDFGQVQLNTTTQVGVRVRNSGAAALTISKADFTKTVFGIANALPLTLEVNGETDLLLTFKPTEPDQRETGKVTVSSDDPAKPTVEVALAGTGVAAVGVVAPAAVAFGEVYVTESKAVTLTLTNAGSNDLPVQDARFTAAVPSVVTADLTTLKKTLKAGESAQTTITFAPQVIVQAAGAVEIVLPAELGTLTVPITGLGVHAQPRLCFKFDDTGLETCTTQTTTFLSLPVGSLCDNRLYPPDGGPSPCVGLDGGLVGPARTAKLYFRNEGNTPVSYSLQFQTQVGNLCDAGSDIDFQFSNAPMVDGGRQATWNEPTVKLPNQVTDPQPWETPPVTMVYRPTSRCAQDAADQARVLWTRQNEPVGRNRPPQTLILNLTGQSLLPRGVAQDITMTGSVPMGAEFRGVGNSGDAPLRVTAVSLWQAEYLALPDGGLGRGTVPFEECLSGGTGDCAVFSWEPGQDPALRLPLVLAGTPNPVPPVTAPLGRIVFGADGGLQPLLNREYKVFAVISTDDPYSPQVVATVRATAH